MSKKFLQNAMHTTQINKQTNNQKETNRFNDWQITIINYHTNYTYLYLYLY